MTLHPYDINSAESIQNYAQKLIGRSLEEAVGKNNLDDASNKGRLGTMVEEHFFEYRPGANKDHEPDFNGAGVELKVTGVVAKSSYRTGESPYKAKERLVLTMINYHELVKEEWYTSSFLKKCSLMLLLFYLYEKIPATQRKFVLNPLLWQFPEEDLVIIKKDWETIRQKIDNGLAHELSEGDTFYLAACRKGSGGPNETLKTQPRNYTPAKSRAFSLKPSYVNSMIEESWRQTEDAKSSKAAGVVHEASLVHDIQDAEMGIEELAIRKFDNLMGVSVEELIARYGLSDANSKQILSTLTLRILGTKKKWLPEFQKSDIVLKTIRLQSNGRPKESMSFRKIDFMKIIEQEWEESDFYEDLEKKFFFAVYQYDTDNVLRFKKVMFWNMHYEDKLDVQYVWEKTREKIRKGDMQTLPKMSASKITHVRPHAKNKADVAPLPNGGSFTKQCFWLNAGYVGEILR